MRHVAQKNCEHFACPSCDTPVRECKYCDHVFCASCDLRRMNCAGRLSAYRTSRKAARRRRQLSGTVRIDSALAVATARDTTA